MAQIRIHMDNVTDLRPVKHLWVQVTHTPMLAVGLDPLGPFNMGATSSTPGPVTTISHGPTSTIFHWDMFPNPPWEDFRIVVFNGGEIDQVVVDTFSVPEPCGIALGAFALFLLGTGSRRACRV